MDSRLLAQLERIAAAGIRLLPTPQLPQHFVFERDGYVVLVERNGEGFGAVGSPGRLLPEGFAALVQRGEQAYFVVKGSERLAAEEEAAAARSLFTQLKTALG
jgi:hypothetical protein